MFSIKEQFPCTDVEPALGACDVTKQNNKNSFSSKELLLIYGLILLDSYGSFWVNTVDEIDEGHMASTYICSFVI